MNAFRRPEMIGLKHGSCGRLALTCRGEVERTTLTSCAERKRSPGPNCEFSKGLRKFIRENIPVLPIIFRKLVPTIILSARSTGMRFTPAGERSAHGESVEICWERRRDACFHCYRRAA
jgi:hypothetical protein